MYLKTMRPIENILLKSVLLLIHRPKDLDDAQLGVSLVLEGHDGVLQDLEASAGQLSDHLLLHHGRVEERVERQLEEIVQQGHGLQPLGVPVPGKVVVFGSLFLLLPS